MSQIDFFHQQTNAENQLVTANITCTSTASLLVTSLSDPNLRRGMWVYNNGSAVAYFGSSTVHSKRGMPIPAGAIACIPAKADVDVYVVCASGETTDLRILEVS